MSKVILGMTMSLDGFVNDRSGGVSLLYPDLSALVQTEELQAVIRTTGAVVMGRRAYEMGNPDEYADHYEFQVPIFVLTHDLPDQMPRQNDHLTFTFVQDGIRSAIESAKAAAGERNVMVIGGACTIQQCLQLGLGDEFHLDIRHVLLGDGLRLLEHTGMKPINLENISVAESPGVTHLKFAIVKEREMA